MGIMEFLGWMFVMILSLFCGKAGLRIVPTCAFNINQLISSMTCDPKQAPEISSSESHKVPSVESRIKLS